MATLQRAEQYAAAWYLDHADSKLAMHNSALAKELAARIQLLGSGQNMQQAVIEQAQIAAIFSQIGYAINFDDPIVASRQFLQSYLIDEGTSSEAVTVIVDCLIPNSVPSTSEAVLYQDAWNSLVFGDSYKTYLPLYRAEMEFMRKEPIRKSVARGWFQSQMRQVTFHTDFAKARYQPILAENKAELDRQVSKTLAREESANEIFGGITDIDPAREIQTFFRTSFDYHTKLIDISDNKARIMISVNSILVSVLISLLTYNFQRVTKSVTPMVIVPILIFLIAAVGSLIFAILSSRPTLTTNTESLFSFMGFRKYSKVDYQKEMDKMLRSGSAILSTMTAALYALGEVLDKKYRYLTVSYNIFMVGFVVSVLMFMVTYFM